MAVPLIPIGVGFAGLLGLWVSYSLVSFVAHWGAVLGGIVVFYTLLKYLVDERPLALFGHEVLDNLTYLAAALPIGFLSFRLLEGVLTGLGLTALLLTVAVIVVVGVASFVAGPVSVLGWIVSIIGVVSDGSD